MKTFAANYGAHMLAHSYTTAEAIKITRTDAAVYAYTSHDIDDTVDGVIYQANPGLDPTSVVTKADLSPSTLELTALHDGTIFTPRDIYSDVWRNAAFVLFRYNYLDLTGGVDTLLAGTLGEIGVNLNTVVAELRSYSQYLQQAVGSASSRDCRYRLGSTSKFAGGLCMKDISAAPFTMPFTLTSVTSNSVFRDSARLEAVDYFGAGEVRWLTGLNAGLFHVVSQYAANGTFTLTGPMFSTVAIGDTGTAIVGCRKRPVEDCTTKFGNRLNYGGEEYRKGLLSLTARPAVSV